MADGQRSDGEKLERYEVKWLKRFIRAREDSDNRAGGKGGNASGAADARAFRVAAAGFETTQDAGRRRNLARRHPGLRVAEARVRRRKGADPSGGDSRRGRILHQAAALQ